MTLLCPHHHENLDGAFFCEVCGEILGDDVAPRPAALLCPHCGVPNTPNAPVCQQCGQPFDPAVFTDLAARLVIVADGTAVPLETREVITIGRADPTSQVFPDVDLTPFGGDELGVSRVHLRLHRKQGRFLIEDQRSVNLTFLNKQRLEPFTPTPIKSGDELRLGRLVARFELVESTTPPPAM